MASRPASSSQPSAGESPSPACGRAASVDEEPVVPFANAPSPVRAVLNRPWPDQPILVEPSSPSGKYRYLVANAADIGDPISSEELAALQEKEGDDEGFKSYKAFARIDAVLRNYIHEHGCLYMDDKGKFIVDTSRLLEKIRCKKITAEEMEEKILEKDSQPTHLSELALASYNKRRKWNGNWEHVQPTAQAVKLKPAFLELW